MRFVVEGEVLCSAQENGVPICKNGFSADVVIRGQWAPLHAKAPPVANTVEQVYIEGGVPKGWEVVGTDFYCPNHFKQAREAKAALAKE